MLTTTLVFRKSWLAIFSIFSNYRLSNPPSFQSISVYYSNNRNTRLKLIIHATLSNSSITSRKRFSPRYIQFHRLPLPIFTLSFRKSSLTLQPNLYQSKKSKFPLKKSEHPIETSNNRNCSEFPRNKILSSTCCDLHAPKNPTNRLNHLWSRKEPKSESSHPASNLLLASFAASLINPRRKQEPRTEAGDRFAVSVSIRNTGNASQTRLLSPSSGQKANYHLRDVSAFHEAESQRARERRLSPWQDHRKLREAKQCTEWYIRGGQQHSRGIRADIRLYLNVGGSISIFHPSNAGCRVQLTHRHSHTRLCVRVCTRSTVRRVGMCLGQYSRRFFLNG